MHKINLILGVMALMLGSCSLKTPTRNCVGNAECFKDENCVLDSKGQNGLCIPLKDFKDQAINTQTDQSKDMSNTEDAQLDQTLINPDQTVELTDQTLAPADQTLAPADQTLAPTDQTLAPADQSIPTLDQSTSPTDMNTTDM
jgi:hypothetical protein